MQSRVHAHTTTYVCKRVLNPFRPRPPRAPPPSDPTQFGATSNQVTPLKPRPHSPPPPPRAPPPSGPTQFGATSNQATPLKPRPHSPPTPPSGAPPSSCPTQFGATSNQVTPLKPRPLRSGPAQLQQSPIGLRPPLWLRPVWDDGQSDPGPDWALPLPPPPPPVTFWLRPVCSNVRSGPAPRPGAARQLSPAHFAETSNRAPPLAQAPPSLG